MYVITTEGSDTGWGKPKAIANTKLKVENFVREEMKKAFHGVALKDVTISFKEGSSGAKWRVVANARDKQGSFYGLDREVFEVESI